MGLVSFMASQSFFQSIDPILPFKLTRQFSFDQDEIGLFFFKFSVVGLVVKLLALCVPHNANKLGFLLGGSLLLPVGTFLTGPSQLLDLPNSLGLMSAGMAVSGAGRSLIQSFFTVYVI